MRRISLKPTERWIVAWIASAALALLLPFPWKRKLTEGLGVACVLLTLPAWSALWERLRAPSCLTTRMSQGLFLFLTALVPFHLFTSQLAWMADPSRNLWFYRSDDIFKAWTYLEASSRRDDVIVTDDLWIDLWTPAYTDRTVWVAHDQETPNFVTKLRDWKLLMTTEDVDTAQRIVAESTAHELILTSHTSLERFERLLGKDAWTVGFQSGDVTVLQRP